MGWAHASGDHLVGLVRGEHADGEGAGHAAGGAADGFFEWKPHGRTRFAQSVVAENGYALVGFGGLGVVLLRVVLELVLDEVGDDLGVGFAREGVAFCDEVVLKGEVVFDDTVVDDDERAGAVAVRVRVLLGGAAVRGPAGVADAVGAVDGVTLQDGVEVAELAGGAAELQALRAAGDGDAG